MCFTQFAILSRDGNGTNQKQNRPRSGRPVIWLSSISEYNYVSRPQNSARSLLGGKSSSQRERERKKMLFEKFNLGTNWRMVNYNCRAQSGEKRKKGKNKTCNITYNSTWAGPEPKSPSSFLRRKKSVAMRVASARLLLLRPGHFVRKKGRERQS